MSPDKEVEMHILSEVGLWFHSNLDALPDSHVAIRDLARRRIPRTLPILGWVPSKREFVHHLKEMGLTPLQIFKSGLCDMRKNSTTFQPFARNALSIMLTNEQGEPERFWRRSYDGSRLKYSSSRLTSYHDFSHSDLFYAHEAARSCGEAGEIYVMEGQFDVMAAHLAGIKNTIGASGCSNFYQNELDSCKRLTHNGSIVLCLDADKAGIEGMLKLANRFPKENIQVCLLPSGKDPCDVRIQYGDEALANALEKRMTMAEFVVRHGSKDSIARYLSFLGPSSQQSALINLASSRLGESPDAVRKGIDHQYDAKPSRPTPKPYTENRRWVKAMSVPKQNNDKKASIKERCEKSPVFKLMTGIAAAYYREGDAEAISKYRRIMPKALFEEKNKEEVLAYGLDGDFKTLTARALSTIWSKIPVD
jgi:DNA primase